jgi:KaiC/GvpD/RAD55 family RecA-like ATPase
VTGAETILTLPLFHEMAPHGFEYGTNYLVEYEPDSLWYETSLTLTAQALKNGLRTEYHTWAHPPRDIRGKLSRLVLDLKRHEEQKTFRIWDTCSRLTGLSLDEEPAVGGIGATITSPTYLKEFAASLEKMVKEGVPETEKEWLHIDDNTSILNRYLEEAEVIETLQNRLSPYARTRELILFHSLLGGVYSDSFYKQFESFCEGIIDFRSREEAGEMAHYMRVRTMRGQPCDTRWRRLRLMESGEVKVDKSPPKASELGISGWIKGSK